ncbi:MAG: imidazole glycerol phosphate synthase subunit HisF [Capnocytophaga sp.]|nr:imidazole glycerol phosphate synthase subunit HisF [Capnocytophaga sp.]
MLKKRIICCLDIKDGRTVKGVQFEDLRDAGDPVELARKYVAENIDELVFLDISATQEERKTLKELVKRISENINIPFTVGGGISSVADAKILIDAGADKISINSAAVRRPQLIYELSQEFGSQCVVVAIDTKNCYGKNYVHTHGGKQKTELETEKWAAEAVSLGAGEILLTSMDADGTKAGFDISITKKIAGLVAVPVIASGGAGTVGDFSEVFNKTKASGALAAGIFHFGEVSVSELKKQLKMGGIASRF